jgi:hypothetical protein
MVIYGLFAEEDIGKLFIAGIETIACCSKMSRAIANVESAEPNICRELTSYWLIGTLNEPKTVRHHPERELTK